jgi:hypothetical protein
LSSSCFSKPGTIDSPDTPGSSRKTLADAPAGATSRSTHANKSAAQRFRPVWVAAGAVRRVVMVGLVSSFGQALQIVFGLVRVRRDIARLRRSNPDEIIETPTAVDRWIRQQSVYREARSTSAWWMSTARDVT